MAQAHIPNTAEMGPDKISELSTELLLHIMSYLPAKDIADLQTLNRTLQVTVSCNESYICRPRIQRELSRIDDEIDYADLTGVPVNSAIRRFFVTYRRSGRCGQYLDAAECHIDYFSNVFAHVYCQQNPDQFTSFLQLECFTYYVLAIDHWLQYREFTRTSLEADAPVHGPLMEALLDALDDTIPVEARYDRLVAFLSRWTDPFIQPQLEALFDEILRAPILARSDWKWRPDRHVPDVSIAQELTFLPRLVEAQIDMPKEASGFISGLATRPEWASRVADRYIFAAGKEKCELGWAALLEETVVVWM